MKNNPIHEKILKVISILLILFILFNVFVNFLHWRDGWTEILWYCDFAAILLSLGILFRKTYLISGVLITAIPAQFFWILDFVLKVIGFEGFGRTAWLFSWPFLTVLPSIVVHAILIPLSLYAVKVYGFDRKGFYTAMFILVFTMFMPFFFSAQDDNVNCVFYPCDISFEHSATYSYLGFTSYSPGYLFIISIRWLIWTLIFYFSLLKMYRSLFKRVKII
jgi:hypothetical protein